MKKTYVLTVSEYFPKKHPRSGESTGFVQAIIHGDKIHTIRGNYELWRKRAEKINNGEAILSVRVWTGKPYNSPQREVAVLDKIGIESIRNSCNLWVINGKHTAFPTMRIADNDGLSLQDFCDWFKGEQFIEPLAIIHFTNYRYAS